MSRNRACDVGKGGGALIEPLFNSSKLKVAAVAEAGIAENAAYCRMAAVAEAVAMTDGTDLPPLINGHRIAGSGADGREHTGWIQHAK